MSGVPKLNEKDLELLKHAHQVLENPDLAARLTALVGTPLERGLALLPRAAHEQVQRATRLALQAALGVASATFNSEAPRKSWDRWHRVATTMSGAVGGAFGLLALGVELPVTTTLLFRSILAIAHAEGEDLGAFETRLACLEVFALGGRSANDDATETGYYATRMTMAQVLAHASEYVGQRGLQAALSDGSAPWVAKLVARIAARFGPAVTQKVAAAALPIVGAATGAAINLLFTQHYQRMAHAHFAIRRLEREYGPELVASTYATL